MAHTNQIREFALTAGGIQLIEPYLGSEGVLTGSARLAQEAKERAAADDKRMALERKQRLVAQKRIELDAQIEVLRSRFENELAELSRDVAEANSKVDQLVSNRDAMAASRRRHDAEVGGRHRQSPQVLRGEPRRPLHRLK